MRYLTIPALTMVLLLLACSPSTDGEASTPTTAETPAAETPAATPTAEAPTAAATAAAGEGQLIVVPGAIFTLPDGWLPETPSSSMRLAQAAIPGEAGNGQLTVFHFGTGGGGGVEANLQRWAGQIEPDPGSETVRDGFTLGAWKVSSIEVAGTLKPSTMGAGPTEPQPGSRLLAAVVEGPGGPWFFKAIGPAATLDAQRSAFLGMLKTGRTHGGSS